MDEDLALALSLQFQDDGEVPNVISVENCAKYASGVNGLNKNFGHQSRGSVAASQPLSIVDESWELIDPVPNIHDLFLQFNDAYFDGRLAGVEVKWSPKMTLCAGLCCYEGRGGLCSIRLSQPLLKLRPRRDLVQTLLHEMIHALLFVTQNNKDHDSHGPEFHKHMYRINKQTGANITVYHNFHDEVNNYRQHWWKCDGACQSRPPFYGIVRRAMNRAPSKNDTWWSEHQRTCGGVFHKIKEPEEYGKKLNKRKRGEETFTKSNEHADKGSNTLASSSQDISKWFKPSHDTEKTVVKTINDCSSIDADNKTKMTVFTGSGHSLVSSSKNTSVISKEEWIKRLMQKQSISSNRKTNKNRIVSVQQQNKLIATSTVTSRDIQRRKDEAEKGENRIDRKFDSNGGTRHDASRIKSSEPSFEVLSSSISLSTSSSSFNSSVIETTSRNNCSAKLMNERSQQNGKIAIIIDDPLSTHNKAELVDCPVCPEKIPINSINRHLDHCLSRGI